MIQKLEQYVIGANYGCGGASFSEVIDKVNEVIDYINSLPEEKPSEDLNDEIKKFIEEYGYERGEDKLLIAIVARHFAEWQKERMMDEWLKDRDGCFWDGVEEGKKAMEKQMLKEAVEGEVVKDINNKLVVTAKNVNLDKFKFGDKVRIIIVKEENK